MSPYFKSAKVVNFEFQLYRFIVFLVSPCSDLTCFLICILHKGLGSNLYFFINRVGNPVG